MTRIWQSLPPASPHTLGPPIRLWVVAVLLMCQSWKPSSCQISSAAPSNCTLLTMATNLNVAEVGSAVHLHCSLAAPPDQSATGSGNASDDLQWFHNGSRLTGVLIEVVDAVTSRLTLESVEIENSGRYSCCLAPNCTEACSTSLDLLVGRPPEPATNLHCESNDFHYANCTWTRGGQHSNLPTTDVLQRKPGTSTSREPEWASCKAYAASVCTDTTCYLTCSRGNMEHKYRVLSSNQLATVSSSNITFSLDKETRPNAPVGIKVTSRSSSSLHVQWSLPVRIHSGILIGFCLQYKWEDSRNITRVKVNSRDMSYTIQNLTHPHGLYWVRVGTFAKHARPPKCWKLSEWVSCRTLEVRPRDSPGNFTCELEESVPHDGNSSLSVNLTWTPLPNRFGQNGNILSYHIVVHNQKVKQSVEAEIRPNRTSHRMEGLPNARHYNISIQAQNSIGLSDPSWCAVEVTVPAPSLVLVFVFIAVSVLVLLVPTVLGLIRNKLKKWQRWPRIKLPEPLNNNIGNIRGHREREVFDDLLPPEQADGVDSQAAGIFNAGACLGAQGGACGGIQPLGALALQDLSQSSAGRDMEGVDVISTGFHHSTSGQVKLPSSGTSSPHSPLSIASEGSYIDLPSGRMRCQRSPGLSSTTIQDCVASRSQFLWDERSIGNQSLGLGVFGESGDRPSAASGMQDKRKWPNELQERARDIIKVRLGGGLLLVPEEQEQGEWVGTERRLSALEGSTNAHGAATARLREEPQGGYCRMGQVHLVEMPADETRESAPALDCWMVRIGSTASTETPISPEGSEGSVWPGWHRDAGEAGSILSDQEPLLSPSSDISLPVGASASVHGDAGSRSSGPVKDFDSLMYIQVCAEGSDEEIENHEEIGAASQLPSSQPLHDPDTSDTPRISEVLDNSCSVHSAATAGPKEEPRGGHLRIDQMGSTVVSENETRASASPSDYYRIDRFGSIESTETSEGNGGSVWQGWYRDAGEVGSILSDQEPLLSPGSDISLPVGASASFHGAVGSRSSGPVKDFDSLTYIQVCTEESDEEFEEQKETSAASQHHTGRPLPDPDTSDVPRNSSQDISTDSDSHLSEVFENSGSVLSAATTKPKGEPQRGYGRMDQMDSKVVSENETRESVTSSDYYQMDQSGSIELNETSEGNKGLSVWLGRHRDVGETGRILSDQEPLLSPGSDISLPVGASASVHENVGSGSSVPVKDSDSLTYVQVYTEGSDEEFEEQEETSAASSQDISSVLEGPLKEIAENYGSAHAAARPKEHQGGPL
ncbi:uncharacterized protein LOC110985181 isoform X2 [Acanthaster planci]|nr:uncharacterized protein LOC110985181 isoform X2 [Acanthaster planci]XP_022101715.1 uncharacterized protein LOC110985181 isoform X2 [Acanthaster planci]